MLHAGFWGMALVAGLRLFSVTRIVVVARILSPASFGAYGIALLVTSLQETVLQRALFSALIQRKGDIESYLDTVWTVRIMVNAILISVLIVISPVIADLLHAPDTVMLIRIMLLTVLIRSLSNIGIVYFEKNLEFQKRFAYEMSFFAAEALVGVVLLFVMRNVWALVYGALIGSIVQVGFSYVIHSRRPHLRLDWRKAIELLRYDRWVLGALTLIFAVNHIDQAVVGRVSGVAQLGIFRMGAQISRNATVELGGVISRAAFPAFSQLQGQPERLRRGFLQAHQWTVVTMLPIMVGAIIFAEEFTNLVLGEQWVPMVPAFRLMLAAGFFGSLMLVINSLFLSTGRPQIGFGILFARLILLAIVIVPLTAQWEAAGAAFGVLASQVVVYPYAIWRCIKAAGFGIDEFALTLIVPTTASVGMIGFLLLVREGFGELQSIPGLVAISMGGAVVYIVVGLAVDVLFGGQISRSLRQKITAQFGTAENPDTVSTHSETADQRSGIQAS